jgi:DNA topoisomerase-3
MLILTEKSSVANDFASALKCPKRAGFFSDGNTEITYCVGHLFSLQTPDFYNDKYKSWKEIPCIPSSFSYSVNESVKQQCKTVMELLKKHSQDEILIATDADREGEVIARECLLNAGITDFRKIKRFWVSQALTAEVIREGMKTAKPFSEYNQLALNGFARQHSDWLCGINFTRYVSVAANKKLSIGRVKTALLSAIETRCSQIENFKSEKFYEHYASFGAIRFAQECKGIYFDSDNNTHFKDNNLAHELENDIDKPASVIENKTEKKETPAPQLYNLNAVQKDAFKLFGYSADETLNIIQKLYEDYKCVSYPRTPSKVMGSGNVELCKTIFEQFSKSDPTFTSAGEISDISLANKRCFNDA